jgi:hypothetical protein
MKDRQFNKINKKHKKKRIAISNNKKKLKNKINKEKKNNRKIKRSIRKF